MTDNLTPEPAGVEVKPDDHYAARMAARRGQPAPVAAEASTPEAAEPPKAEEKPAETAPAETAEAKPEETAASEAGETATEPQAEDADAAKRRKRRTLEEENYRLRQKNRELREQVESRGANGDGRPAETQKPPEPAKRPRQEEFTDYDAYLEAVVDWKAEQKLQERDARQMRAQSEGQIRQQQNDAAKKFATSAEKARDKYDDFDDAVTDPDLTITPAMAAIVAEADDPGELAYHLAKNPQEARRIANMSPAKAAMELGRIEDRMKAQAPKPAAVPPKRETQAPPPPKVVAGGTGKPQTRLEERTPDDYYAQRKANIKAGVR